MRPLPCPPGAESNPNEQGIRNSLARLTSIRVSTFCSKRRIRTLVKEALFTFRGEHERFDRAALNEVDHLVLITTGVTLACGAILTA